MNENRQNRGLAARVLLALLFIGIGSLIMIVFSPLRPLLAPVPDYLGRAALIAGLLVVTLLLRRSATYSRYAPVFVGLCILAVAVSLDFVSGVYLQKYLGVSGRSPSGLAAQKFNELVVVAATVVALTRLSGGSLGSIYLQKGNLRQGLITGGVAFLIALAGSVPMAALMFKGQNMTAARLVSWLPWLLICSLSNGAQEELLFRGLFLRKLETFYGRFLANFLIMFVFTLLHNGATYQSSQFFFLVALVPLALVWGYLMQKTDAAWGSILFHAGTDIPVFLGIFSNL